MISSRSHRLGGALALFAGVGCATAIVDEDPEELPAGAGTAGLPSAGGSSNLGAAGRGGRSNTTGGAGTMSSAGASAGGMGVVAICPAPRTPDQPGAAQGNSGSFDTTEAVCYFVDGTFNTWNCSNIAGRSVTINGVPSMCGGSLPEKVDGGYYFEFGAASDGTNYTSFYWYTS